MKNDRLRLVMWCFGMSAITVVCTWVLVGPPDVQMALYIARTSRSPLKQVLVIVRVGTW